jgi:hypothetical protein
VCQIVQSQLETLFQSHKYEYHRRKCTGKRKNNHLNRNQSLPMKQVFKRHCNQTSKANTRKRLSGTRCMRKVIRFFHPLLEQQNTSQYSTVLTSFFDTRTQYCTCDVKECQRVSKSVKKCQRSISKNFTQHPSRSPPPSLAWVATQTHAHCARNTCPEASSVLVFGGSSHAANALPP